MTLEEIMDGAKTIATILRECETEYRGELLFEVALNLRLHTQHFTAKLIEEAALKYGIPVTEPRAGRDLEAK